MSRNPTNGGNENGGNENNAANNFVGNAVNQARRAVNYFHNNEQTQQPGTAIRRATLERNMNHPEVRKQSEEGNQR